MDQIDPILPTHHAISPIDASRVKVRGARREDRPDGRAGGHAGTAPGEDSSPDRDDEDGEEGPRHVDVRA